MRHPFSFFFTDHEDGIPLAVDGKVTGHADSFQQGYIVFRDTVFSGSLHFAQDGEAEVHKFHGDHRVVHQVLLLQPLFYQCGNLAPGHARYGEASQHGKVDVTFVVKRIAGNFSVVVTVV